MPNFDIENSYENEIIYGVDEAGLGPLAGPITVASCFIEKRDLPIELLEGIDDSKKLSKKKREYLFEMITNSPNIKYEVAVISNDAINEAGLSRAWRDGIRKSVEGQKVSLCLIDGIKKVAIPGCKTISIVKGDQKSYSIAAASIIAKTTRDAIMQKIHEEFPYYGFDKHVGYGTKAHLEALRKFGPCKYHRINYSPVRAVLENSKIRT
ncbi:MAG: ribonuclease HII [Holosporales bacterium]|jgi:ribonuclease HII|nr:ribonuclease HII [Holosporales bacterium]